MKVGKGFPTFPTPDTEEPTRSPITLGLKLPRHRRGYGGLTASLLIHGLVIGLVVIQGDRLWSRTLVPGPTLHDGGGRMGGGGANRVAYITLPSIPEPAVVPPSKVTPPVPPPKPVALPAPEPEQPEAVAPVDTVSTPASEPSVPAEETGPGAGAGSGEGDAKGEGQGKVNGVGGTGAGPGGEGGKIRPPEPREMAFPFDTPPKELRGISLNVTFWVRVDGGVERYTVEPEIKDRDYAKKFDEVMRAFRFTPARAPDGTRVPGTTRISFTLPGKSSS